MWGLKDFRGGDGKKILVIRSDFVPGGKKLSGFGLVTEVISGWEQCLLSAAVLLGYRKRMLAFNEKARKSKYWMMEHLLPRLYVIDVVLLQKGIWPLII